MLNYCRSRMPSFRCAYVRLSCIGPGKPQAGFDRKADCARTAASGTRMPQLNNWRCTAVWQCPWPAFTGQGPRTCPNLLSDRTGRTRGARLPLHLRTNHDPGSLPRGGSITEPNAGRSHLRVGERAICRAPTSERDGIAASRPPSPPHPALRTPRCDVAPALPTGRASRACIPRDLLFAVD